MNEATWFTSSNEFSIPGKGYCFFSYEDAVNKTFNDAADTMIGTILPELLESVK